MPGESDRERVAREIRTAISSGQYRRGDALPSTRDLTERFDVSTSTVTRALSALKDEGVVHGRQGRRYYVGPESDATSRPRSLADRVAELERRLDEHLRNHP